MLRFVVTAIVDWEMISIPQLRQARSFPKLFEGADPADHIMFWNGSPNPNVNYHGVAVTAVAFTTTFLIVYLEPHLPPSGTVGKQSTLGPASASGTAR
jgi:hypothetical protein